MGLASGAEPRESERAHTRSRRVGEAHGYVLDHRTRMTTGDAPYGHPISVHEAMFDIIERTAPVIVEAIRTGRAA